MDYPTLFLSLIRGFAWVTIPLLIIILSDQIKNWSSYTAGSKIILLVYITYSFLILAWYEYNTSSLISINKWFSDMNSRNYLPGIFFIFFFMRLGFSIGMIISWSYDKNNILWVLTGGLGILQWILILLVFSLSRNMYHSPLQSYTGPNKNNVDYVTIDPLMSVYKHKNRKSRFKR